MNVIRKTLLAAVASVSERSGMSLSTLPPASRTDAILKRVRDLTMCDISKILCWISASTYVSDNDIKGDVAEVGVWRGGMVIASMLALQARGDSRTSWLYDTFNGMTEPTLNDARLRSGKSAHREYRDGWCKASVREVETNIRRNVGQSTDYRIIEGDVANTLPSTRPKSLALLRLDVDWHEPTLHSLRHLEPLLNSHGVLVIDDYNTWSGCRAAVNQYFDSISARPLFVPVGRGSVIAVKTW